jgi:hypothetical protein
MSLRIQAATVAIMLGVCGSASATEVMVGGPSFPGTAGNTGLVFCRIFNFGSVKVHFKQNRIYDSHGDIATLFLNTCTGVAPTKSCAYGAEVASDFAYSCRSLTDDAVDSLIGTIEIETSDGTVLSQLPMRAGVVQSR